MTDLGVELDLAALEAVVVALEVEAGWSIPGASRPLHPWEARARVRFSALDRIADDGAGAIVRIMLDVRAAATAALLADLRGQATTADLLARVTALASATDGATLPIAADLARAEAAIVEVLLSTRLQASAELLGEAARQGVPAWALPDAEAVKIPPAERAAMQAVAQHVAEAPARRLLDVAAKESRFRGVATATVGAVVDAIGTALEAVKDTGWGDDARQAAQRAVNAGRAAAAQETPEPQEVYASELLDGNTCEPCAAVDGRMYESLDAALVDYPGGGTYADCLGGPRCRGTLVIVWPSEVAPSLDQGPYDRVGRFPVDRTPRGPSIGGAGGALPDAG